MAGPIDNKGCLFRKLADVMAGVKSAAKEVGTGQGLVLLFLL